MFSGKFEKSKDNSKTKSKPKSKGHRFAETKAKKTDRQTTLTKYTVNLF